MINNGVKKIFRAVIGGREEDKIWISCMDNYIVAYRINKLSINLTLELILETKWYTLLGKIQN